MSLVRCPECGHQDVSSLATSCPYCGYNIKAHFDAERRIENEKRMAVLSKQTEQNIVNRKIQDVKYELEKKIKSIEASTIPAEPPKPCFFKCLFHIKTMVIAPLVLVIIIVCVCLLLAFLLIMCNLELIPALFLTVAFLTVIFLMPPSISCSWNAYKDMREEHDSWEEQISDFDGYKKRLISEEKKKAQEIINNLTLYGTKDKPKPKFKSGQYRLRCPYCDSENILYSQVLRWYIVQCGDCNREILRRDTKPRL